MSIQHDNLSVDPRLDTLLRGMLTADDLQPAQSARVRARLGLVGSPSPTGVTLTIPASSPLTPTTRSEDPRTITPPRRLRRQWLQFALAAVAFVAVGLVLALVFGSSGDGPDIQPGTPADPAQAVRDALAPLPPEQERRTVLEVETHTTHDNAFDRWTIDRWQRWSAGGVLDEGLFVSGPAGESVTHIILDGQGPLMNWAPRDWALDVPLEYSLQRRVFAATLDAVNDPETHNLQHETRDGQVVLTFEWNDNQSEEFDYIHRGEAWIDPETGHLQRIVHFVDRPDQEPYPTRTYTFRESEILPAGSSPDGTYTIEGSTRPSDVFATETAIATVPPALPTTGVLDAPPFVTQEQAITYALDILAGKYWDNSDVAASLHAVDPVVTAAERRETGNEVWWEVQVTGRFEVLMCPVRRLPTPGTRICNVGDGAVITFRAESGKDASIEISLPNEAGTVGFGVNSSNWIDPTPTP